MRNAGCIKCSNYCTNSHGMSANIQYTRNIGCMAHVTHTYNSLTGKDDMIAGPCNILNANGDCTLFQPKQESEPEKPKSSAGFWKRILGDRE